MSETKTVIGADTPLRDAAPSAPEVLRPGSTWTGPDGTVYDVVRAEDVGDRPRWWFLAGFRGDQIGLEHPGELHTDAVPGGAGMLLALVRRAHAPIDCPTSGMACEACDPGHGTREAAAFSLESARAMLANLERLPPDVSADDARCDLWVELRAACDEVERLRADVLGLAAELGAAEGARDGARSRLDGLRESLYIVAHRLGANLPTGAERYAEDAALRVELGRAQYRKAEARVAVLTEERDGLTLRLGQQVRKRVQRSKAKAGARKGGRR